MRNFIVTIVIFILAMSTHISAASAAEDLKIQPDYILISSKRITRVIFEYKYKAKITNSGLNDISGASAQVRSLSNNTKITGDTITFGKIPKGTTVTSNDTFTLTQDRTFPFNPADLVWTISPDAAIMTPQQRIQSLEDQGALPKLERSTDVQGSDINTNGIRDDIETYIATNYTSSTQRAAAEQFARVMQAAMLVDKTDIAAAKAIALQGSKAVNCIYSRFDGNAGSKQPAAVVEELKSVSTNTKTRLLAYLAYSKALDGTAGSIPEGETCE